MAGDTLPPLRVGLVGCGRIGLHLIERSAVGGPFQVVAASEELDVSRLIAPFGVRLMSLPELAQSTDVDVLWGTSYWDFPFDRLPLETNHVQHLIVETPFTLSPPAAEQAFADASRRGRLLIHHPWRADLDFRQALAVARDEKLGAIRAVKFVLWSYARPPRGATRCVEPAVWDELAQPGATKLRFVAHALDQLVLLVLSRPIRVFAVGDRVADGNDLFAGDSLALHVLFESGCEAEIDVRLDSPVPVQSGWMLTGERGGYAKGRQHTLTDEGEVFDSPVTPAGNPEDTDQFEWLARQIRSGVPDATEEACACFVVTLLDGAQRSLVTNQPVILS